MTAFKLDIDIRELRDTLQRERDDAPKKVAARVTAAAWSLFERLYNQTEDTLGERLARTWKVARPASNQTAGPVVAQVFSKAPAIIAAFDQGVTITGRSGNWLAIPTEHVPRRPGRGAGRRLTPVEVEARFNRELIYIPNRGGRTARLVLPSVIRSRSGRGWKQDTANRRRAGRQAEDVVMFILVPQVTLTKRLDVAAAIAAVAARYPDLAVNGLP